MFIEATDLLKFIFREVKKIATIPFAPKKFIVVKSALEYKYDLQIIPRN